MDDHILRDSECGKAKGCYSNCINNVCDWETSWQDKGDYLIISLKSSLTNDSGYVSLGFSNTSLMGPATVYYCVLINSTISVIPGLTFDNYGHREDNLSKDGISHEVNNFTDGVLQCRFNVQKVTNDSQLFNLNQSWYLITARGLVEPVSGSIRRHVGRNSTNHRVNLTDVTTNEYFTAATSTLPHPSTTTPATSIQTLTKFVRDSDCGKAKGCYSNCVNNDCDWETSWQDKGDYLDISLKSSLGFANGYVSLGFSNTSSMGPATVYYCVLYNGSINVIPGLTNGHHHTEANVSKDGISHQVNNFTDGVLQCRFNVQKVNNDSQLFHLNQSWYLNTARGPVNQSSLKFHGNGDRNVTTNRVNLTDITINEYFSTVATTNSPPSTPTTEIQAGKFHNDQDCGSKKGCYSRCVNNQCDLLVTWIPKGNNIEFTLTSSTSNKGDYYIAIGFNKDQKMSESSVVACTVNQGKNVDIFVSRNVGFRNIPLNNPKEGVFLLSGSYKDGLLQCTFTRFGPAVNKTDTYDLSKPWYLITARGVAEAGGVLLQHDSDDRFISQALIDFRKVNVDISLEVTKYPLIKAHSCLMIITWMFLASIGLGFARFLKPLWPSSMPCGVKVWFAMHRAFMVLAFLSGCAGFIIIFVEVQDYSEIKGEFYTRAHPILGIITTALLVINPFMSLLRCGPDDPRRPYFNWAHRAAGTIAQILATITVTVGLYLPKAQVDIDVGLAIMIAYSAWHLCYFLIMSLLNDLKVNIGSKSKRSHKKSANSYAMNHLDQTDGDDDNKKPTSPNSGLKKLFQFLHVLVLSGLTCTLLYINYIKELKGVGMILKKYIFLVDLKNVLFLIENRNYYN
ncbi:hypothetical protein Btru_027500 [Bulinus truncatus]|nr:hypothetical protein Btru_027500 [Bulinus truncatus]